MATHPNIYMTKKFLKVSSWNARGFGDPHMSKTVKKWVKHFHKNLDMLCLQERKAQKEKVEFQLKTLFQDSTYVVDYTTDARARAAVVAFPHLKVIV